MRVPNAKTVTLSVDGGRATALVLKLSSTGGLLGLKAPVQPGSLADLTLDIGFGKVSGLVEMLQPRKSGTATAQAFRFVALEDHHNEALQQTLDVLSKQGLRES